MKEIFKAYDIRGKVNTELTPELVKKIGEVFANWLPNEGPIVVGHDMRADSRKLADELIEGIISQGRDVWDIGLATSDMVYFSPGKYGVAGGAMVTASHNTGEYNGIKVCREQALPVGLESGLDEIRDRVLSDNEPGISEKVGKIVKKDVMDDWIQQVLSFIDVSKLKKFHIAVDAGNGMSGLTVPRLAPHIPLSIEQMYFDLDGTFPNHEANPMKVETLNDISKLIIDKGLDFGIAFDGDADRMALIDEKGVPLTGSMTCALLAQYVLAKSPGGTIVHDLRMSRSTIELIKSLGGKTVRTKVGNTIIKQSARQNNAAFGGEITGHFMFRDNYFVDSGLVAAMVAVQILSEADFTLSEFVKKYDIYKHKPEVNLVVEDKQAAMKEVEAAFTDGEIDWLDGLSVNYDDCWFNLRPSNTESIMRLNGEAKTTEKLEELIAKVTSVIEAK